MNDDLKYPVCNLCGYPHSPDDDDNKTLSKTLKDALVKEIEQELKNFYETSTLEEIRALKGLFEKLRQLKTARRHCFN
jgi:Tfp pilus assembly PilM family ATPase